MPLSIGVVFEARAPGDSGPAAHRRLELLREPLVARGDIVHVVERRPGEGVTFYPRAVRELSAARPLDAIVLSGSPRALSFAAALGRLAHVELILDLARAATPLDVVLAAAATRVIARDEASHRAMLAAGVPVYRAGLVFDPLAAPGVAARAKEPPVRHKVRLRVVARDAAELDAARALVEAARQVEPKLFAEPRVPPELLSRAAILGGDAAALVDPDPTIAEAHAVLVVGSSTAAARAAGGAMAAGVPLLWGTTESPWGIAGAERVTPDAAGGRRLGEVVRDKVARAALTARGRAWDETYGWPAQSRLWLRTVDAACEAKVLAERRARQAAIEGVKTGTRKT